MSEHKTVTIKPGGLSGFEQSLNPEFRQVVRALRRALPYIAAGFLLFVYGVSAWTGGSLLMKLTVGTLAFGIILAYAINAAIQIGRMILVFYPLLNPTRPTIGYNGEITGIILGGASIFEIWGLVMATGMHHAVATTASILMVIGVLAELYFLREIKFHVKMELISNKAYWRKIIESKIAEKRFEQLMDMLDRGEIPDSIPELKFEETEDESTTLPGRRGLARRFKDFHRIDDKKQAAPGGSTAAPLDLSDPALMNLEVVTS